MIFYRVAFQGDQPETWKWRSTSVTSMNALLLLLQTYKSLPQDRIRVFFGTSRESMEKMLQRENQGLVSTSVTADQMLDGKSISNLEVARLEMELNEGESVDEPYVFTAPTSIREMSAWIALMNRVRAGEFPL